MCIDERTDRWDLGVRLEISSVARFSDSIVGNGDTQTHRQPYIIVVSYACCHFIPEDTILHSHRRENLKSYICSVC
jgi:hypothetical protein